MEYAGDGFSPFCKSGVNITLKLLNVDKCIVMIY